MILNWQSENKGSETDSGSLTLNTMKVGTVLMKRLKNQGKYIATLTDHITTWHWNNNSETWEIRDE